jgi:hypothetical protein
MTATTTTPRKIADGDSIISEYICRDLGEFKVYTYLWVISLKS